MNKETEFQKSDPVCHKNKTKSCDGRERGFFYMVGLILKTCRYFNKDLNGKKKKGLKTGILHGGILEHT